MRPVVFKFSFFLLTGLLAEWWLTKLSGLDIPENIPHTPIRISGLLLITLITLVLIAFQKQLLRLDREKTIVQLTVLGGFMILPAEIIFQVVRQLTMEADEFNDRIYTVSRSAILITIFGLVFSFLVAFQLKTKKTGQLVLITIGVFILFDLLTLYFDKTA